MFIMSKVARCLMSDLGETCIISSVCAECLVLRELSIKTLLYVLRFVSCNYMLSAVSILQEISLSS